MKRLMVGVMLSLATAAAGVLGITGPAAAITPPAPFGDTFCGGVAANLTGVGPATIRRNGLAVGAVPIAPILIGANDGDTLGISIGGAAFVNYTYHAPVGCTVPKAEAALESACGAEMLVKFDNSATANVVFEEWWDGTSNHSGPVPPGKSTYKVQGLTSGNDLVTVLRPVGIVKAFWANLNYVVPTQCGADKLSLTVTSLCGGWVRIDSTNTGNGYQSWIATRTDEGFFYPFGTPANGTSVDFLDAAGQGLAFFLVAGGTELARHFLPL